MQRRAPPVVRLEFELQVRDRLCGHRATPCDVAGKPWRAFAEQLVPDDRVDAVGTDDRRTFPGRAVLEGQRGPACVLVDVLYLASQVNVGGPERPGHDIEDFRPVRMQVGRPEVLLGHLAQGRPEDALARLPGAHFQRLRPHADALQFRPEAELHENPHYVARQLDARADFAEGFGLLEQFERHAARAQAQGRCDAADAATGNEDGFHA